jgi:hypothetical protein
MPPVWKIKRELSRVVEQLHGIYEIATHPIRQLWIDKKSDKAMRFTQGVQYQSNISPEKIVIYLIYQPNGITNSVETTCKHFLTKGYAVLLIANHPISENDKSKLSPFVWRFVTRKNHGYDFGGYKDGIRLLWRWEITPSQLVIVNDSIWFPLYPNCDLIERMEHSNAQFVGAKRHTLANIPDAEFEGFFESYFFLIKKLVWQSNTFIEYWKNYISTSNKYLTVRRGERGFSSTIFRSKIASEGIYSRDRFMEIMSQQEAEILRKTLYYGAYTEEEFETQSQQLIKDFKNDGAWREAALQLIRDVTNRRNFVSSFCYPCVGILKIYLMKKNRGQLQLRMRRKYVLAVHNGDLSMPDSATFQEILSSIED